MENTERIKKGISIVALRLFRNMIMDSHVRVIVLAAAVAAAAVADPWW